MRQFAVVRYALGAAIAVAMLSGSIAEAAPAAKALTFRKIGRTAFTAEIPHDWKMSTRRKYGADQSIGRYSFRSPTGSGVFRINFQKDGGGDFKAAAEADYQQFRKRISEPKIHSQEISKEDGRDVAFRVFEGLLLRKDFMRPYMFARILVRRPNAKKLVAFTLAMSHDKLDGDRFTKILERFVNTLKFKDPKPAAPTKAAAVKK